MGRLRKDSVVKYSKDFDSVIKQLRNIVWKDRPDFGILIQGLYLTMVEVKKLKEE